MGDGWDTHTQNNCKYLYKNDVRLYCQGNIMLFIFMCFGSVILLAPL